MTTLSVIMPALNEQDNIQNAVNDVIAACSFYNITAEIIIVDDGSSDNTRNIAEQYAKKYENIRVMCNKKNRGIGYSFFRGVHAAKHEVVVMFPSDNENNVANALEFFHIMDHVDIIVPFIHNSEVRNKPRRFISSLFRFIINISFGINLNYTNGTVFYRRCLFNTVSLSSYGFFYQAELLIKLIRKGYLFAEVPNFLKQRISGNTKAISFGSLTKIIKDYMKLVYTIHIKRIETQRDYYTLAGDSVSYKKCIFNEKG